MGPFSFASLGYPSFAFNGDKYAIVPTLLANVFTHKRASVTRKGWKEDPLGAMLAAQGKAKKKHEFSEKASLCPARMKIAGAVGLGFLMLSTIGVSTYAWFTTNRSAKTSYTGIVAQNPTLLGDPTYYRFVRPADYQEGTSPLTFTPINDGNYDLGAFRDEDLLGESSYRMLLQVPVVGKVDSVIAFARSEKETILVEKTQSDGTSRLAWPDTFQEDPSKANGLTNPLSAVVSFSAYCDSEIDQTPRDVVSASGTYSCIALSSPKTGKGFVEVDSSSVPETLSYAEKGKLDIPSGETTTKVQLDGEKNLWILLDYNKAAVVSLYTENIGNALFEEGMLQNGKRLGYVAFYRDFVLSAREAEA